MSRDPHTGTVRAAAKLDGALTAPSGRDAEAVALDYVRTHARALGLDATRTPPGLERARRVVDGRMQLITWGQRYRGIPSADTYLKAAIDERGRLLSLTGAPAAELAPPTVEPALDRRRGRRRGHRRRAAPGTARAGGAERATAFRGGARASLVLYQGEGGTRLAWRVIAPISGAELADALVDAADGAVVKRANRVKFATAKVFASNPDDSEQVGHHAAAGLGHGRVAAPGHARPRLPRPERRRRNGAGSRARVRDESTAGADCSARATAARSRAAPGPRRSGCSTRTRARRSSTTSSTPSSITSPHAPIGFSDASGGFGPNDRIFAQSMDSANKPAPRFRDNASFATYPDGGPGFLDVFLFSRDGVRLDGVNDASLIFHEVGHALTERLVTDGQGWGALTIGQAAAIAEGTSDFYAMDYLAGLGLETDTPLRFGEYLGTLAPRHADRRHHAHLLRSRRRRTAHGR